MNFRAIRLVGLCLASVSLLMLTGCVVAIGTGRETPPPPPAVVMTDSADAATLAEIDAAARLSFDSARAEALSRIATRDGLPCALQIHLVNVVFRRLSFESNKMEVLSKIIARPDFEDRTRHTIVAQLNQLSFDSNRQSILQQINERLKHKPVQ